MGVITATGKLCRPSSGSHLSLRQEHSAYTDIGRIATGGENGQVGQNAVRRLDGSIEKLKGCDATVIDAGEALIIQTPTAGGYGKPGS